MKLSQLVTLLALFKQERYCFHVWHASLKSNHFEQGSFYLSRKETEWEKARDNHHSTPSLLKSESLCPTRQDHPSWKGLVRFTFGRCFKKQRFLRLAHTFRVIVLGAPHTNPESNKNQLLLHNRYWLGQCVCWECSVLPADSSDLARVLHKECLYHLQTFTQRQGSEQSCVNVQLSSHFPAFPEYTFDGILWTQPGNAKAISNINLSGNVWQLWQKWEVWRLAMWSQFWGKKILATSENDLYVNLICKLYFCSCERGKLML